MLHASETWPLTKTNMQRNDWAMIRQYQARGCDLDLILTWFEHVKHSSGAARTACDIQVDGRREPGRPEIDEELLP